MEKHGARPSPDEAANGCAQPGAGDSVVCGLVLAGGDGRRLESFIRSVRKDPLPKQFVNFIGRRSMLQHTIDRAQRFIPSERVFTVVNQRHMKYAEVKRQLSNRSPGTVVLQPGNKETGPGLLFPLMHLYKRYPNSVVAVFPSDHFILEEERLIHHVRMASVTVQRDPSRLVLLGVKPDAEEPQYGYIVPGKKLATVALDTAEISWFIEKPDPLIARRLIEIGALWNTMIMVFQTSTLLHWVRRLAPAMHSSFQKIYEAIETEAETRTTREVYRELRPVNFSKELLEPMVAQFPSSVVTLPVRNVLWSDWGTAERILDVLRRTGTLTRLNGWSNPKPSRVHRTPSRLSPDTLAPRTKEFAVEPASEESLLS